MFGSKRFQHIERQLRLTPDAMGGPENQSRTRMTRNCFEDFARLFRGKRSVSLQQSGSMPQRNIQCPNGLRNAVQLNIQSIPAGCYGLIRISRACFVKSTTRFVGWSFSIEGTGIALDCIDYLRAVVLATN